jgi:hypothetical protein
MFKNKSFFSLTALVFLGVNSASTAKADSQCYTVASLKGTYAIVANYGSYVGVALGLRRFDGKGNQTGTFTINIPTTGSTARTIVTGTQVGTYTVNCDGTGVGTRTVQANGVTITQIDDFVITRATVADDGHFIATALADAQRELAPFAGGLFVTRSFTRLPDERRPDED